MTHTNVLMRVLRMLVIGWGLLLGATGVASGQTCTYNAGQPNTASFGTIDPTLSVTKVFSLTINYKCTGGANASFTITGANDTGPGAYRLRHVTQLTQFMNYTITTADLPGTKIVLNGQLVAADYQDAYVGSYADILNVLVLP
ncbi:MAG: hypothetical protein ABI777_11060 [Betaproteobacteria bacterium]